MLIHIFLPEGFARNKSVIRVKLSLRNIMTLPNSLLQRKPQLLIGVNQSDLVHDNKGKIGVIYLGYHTGVKGENLWKMVSARPHPVHNI